MKKKIIGMIACVVVVGLIFLGRYLHKVNTYRKIISDIVITDVDLKTIDNGVYSGSFDALMISANVSVTIADNKIINISIDEHKTERGQSAESITESVIYAQSLEVDTISGATNSSKVILKAIENALV